MPSYKTREMQYFYWRWFNSQSDSKRRQRNWRYATLKITKRIKLPSHIGKSSLKNRIASILKPQGSRYSMSIYFCEWVQFQGCKSRVHRLPVPIVAPKSQKKLISIHAQFQTCQKFIWTIYLPLINDQSPFPLVEIHARTWTTNTY